MTDPLRLFLIEDDDDIALLMRKSLERVGHRVSRCRTAADALIVLGQNAFDLVLLDQRLPDMAGLDLLHALAREGIASPVLMVTGYGDEQLASCVLRAGALDYLVKDPALTFLGELPKRVAESVTRHRLEHLNRLLIQALESARDGIMITDLQGSILHVNRALEQMTGYGRHELLGANPRLLKSKVHAQTVYAELWRTVLARSSWQGELTNRRKDGSLFQSSLTVSPIVDGQGRLTHFVGILRDVTEHKQLERQLLQAQKMQSIGTLAGGVAHEFNNLLAGINGYAALGLREPGLSPTIAEFLQQVIDLSVRAAALTGQLLAFARKPALSRQRTNLVDLVRRTADLVTTTLQRRVQLELADAGGDGRPLIVAADANQLQQALVNLALNSRDAVRERETDSRSDASQGSVLFRVSHAVLDAERPAFPQNVPPGDYVLLEVADNGVGMSPEVLSQAIDPFFTTKDVGQGTGLGLPMVFGIVQGHQGYLTLDSSPGQGTCVGLYLPRLPLSADGLRPNVLPAPPPVLAPMNAKGQAILVIDDEEAVLDVIRRFLQIAGHQVTGVCTGREALEHLSAGQPVDVVILDLMMPREDAATTLHQIRQRRPGVPVLVCTGLPSGDSGPELLRHKGVAILRKPFRMNELWAAVQQVLAVSQS